MFLGLGSKHVLPAPQGGEASERVVCSGAGVCGNSLAHCRVVGAQKRVDLALQPNRARQGGPAGRSVVRATLQPGIAFRIVRFGRTGKAEVGQRVFVGAIDAGLGRESGQTLQRCMQLFGSPPKQAAAAGTEQGIARKQDARGEIGDMGLRVAGHVQHLELEIECLQPDAIAFGHAMGHPSNGLARRPKHRQLAPLDQRENPPGVVWVMVGDEDRRKRERVSVKIGLDDGCIARVNHRQLIPPAQRPDVVVLKGRERQDFEGWVVNMSSVHASDAFSMWLHTAQGQVVLDWQQVRFDAVVADIFGYNAVQVGLPSHAFLAASRISHCFTLASQGEADLLGEAFALPLASGSMDLVVLPHVLEFSRHPHQVLREVERVLVPEGSVLISGLNPFSLYGVRRALSRSAGQAPWCGHYFSTARLRDWLTLLGFDIVMGEFGCHAPPLTSPTWQQRFAFMDRVGRRWWPVCGGAYMLHGIKRVQGMRLILPKWRNSQTSKKGLSPVARCDHDIAAQTHKAD